MNIPTGKLLVAWTVILAKRNDDSEASAPHFSLGAFLPHLHPVPQRGEVMEVFSGGYTTCPDFPCLTRTADQVGRAVFYIQQEVNERFTTCLT